MSQRTCVTCPDTVVIIANLRTHPDLSATSAMLAAFHPPTGLTLSLRRVPPFNTPQCPTATGAPPQTPPPTPTSSSLPPPRHPLRTLVLAAVAAVALRLPSATLNASAAPSPSVPVSAPEVVMRAPARTSARLAAAASHRVATAFRPTTVPTRSVLAAVPSPSTPLRLSTLPTPVSVADRAGFWAGEFLMWNPAAKVIALLACTLVAMYLGSFLYRLADPLHKEAKAPFWHSVRAIANPLEDDWENNALRATSITLAAIGMVVFAIMVGMVTESVESAVRNVDGDLSPVVVSDHILVCGWSPHVSQILKDVTSVSKRVKVVVLASPEHKQRMLDHMRSVLSEEERSGLRLYYRPGAPIVREDLDRVAASRAKKIILINARKGDSVDADRRILSRALAIRQNLPGFKGDIVAEINSVRDEAILQSILNKTSARSVETINTEQLLFRFMAQAIRQPGLADVVANLMGDEPSRVFHAKVAKEVAPQLVGANYADLRPTSIPGSVLCGFFDRYGKVHIGTGQAMIAAGEGTTLSMDTPLLLLGAKSSDVGGVPKRTALHVSSSTVARMDTLATKTHHSGKKAAETFLVCGWRDDMKAMLTELDSILFSGSKVTILDEDTPDALPQQFKNLTVTCVKKRPDRYENLEELLSSNAKPYDHVVLLGSAYGDDSAGELKGGQEQDTKTLASLVYVNELLSKQYDRIAAKGAKLSPSIVTVEFINERVAEMAREQGNVTNAILPQNLSAKIAAQTVRDSRLNSVWNELLSQRGREVYMRPCAAYADIAAENYSFATMTDTLAKTTDDIVIGYVCEDGRVIINPQGDDKFTSRVWDKRDMLIVLSNE